MRRNLMGGLGRSIGFAAVVAGVWLGLGEPAAAQCVSATLIGQLEPQRGLAFDHFGYSVAVSGDTAVVGVPDGRAPGSTVSSGVAYVFVRVGTVWMPQGILTQPGAALNDEFGWSVAISGDTIVVGALDDDTVAGANAGTASVWVRSGTQWTFQQQLTAPAGAAGDLFGSSVAISGDTIVVGAQSDDITAGLGAGSAFVFTRSGTAWTLQATLNALDAGAGDNFGVSAAIDGNTVVIGADSDDTTSGTDAGSAYVFTRSGTVWSQQQKLTGSDSTSLDNFGFGVSISADTVVAGAWGDDTPGGSNAGSAYVFTRSGTVWSQQQKLEAPDATAFDLFGRSVSVSTDTVAIGAPDSGSPSGTLPGATYVFKRTGVAWALEQKVVPSDGAAQDFFGQSVSLAGDTVITGARMKDGADGSESGAAYVHVRSGAVWSHQQQLQTPDGTAADDLGRGVASSGDTALVGNPEGLTPAGHTGSVYVWVRSGAAWVKQAELWPADGTVGGHFGFAVAIEGNTAVVGAFGDSTNGANGGAVYVYVRSGSVWSLQQKLPKTGLLYFWGAAVSISGDTLAIGAPGTLNAGFVQTGAVQVYTRSGTVWTAQQAVFASDGSSLDDFGQAVAVWGDTLVVGARSNDTAQGADAGTVYIFTRTGGVWSQQYTFASSETTAVAQYGCAVSLEGDTLVVGSENHSALQPNWGAAYVYTRSGGLNGAWTQRAILRESDGSPGLFGTSVSLSGDTLAVGARYDNPAGLGSGSVDIFTRSGGLTGAWTWRGNVVPPDRALGDAFGSCVALAGSRLIVGAPTNDTAVGTDAGMAYAFDLNDPSLCPPDFDCSGVITVTDIFAFLNAWFAGNPQADIDGGGLAVSDVFAFLNAWFMGC